MVNVSTATLVTHPEVVLAVVEELLALGIDPQSIIIWDSHDYQYGWNRAGYEEIFDPKGITLRYTSDEQAGFSSQTSAYIPSADLKLPGSSILADQCTYIINMPVMKHHSLCGITVAPV